MDGLLFGFVVFFVLAIACVCALGVVRMLGRAASRSGPPWPHLQPRTRHGRWFHRARHSA
jgi:hypothetical protein